MVDSGFSFTYGVPYFQGYPLKYAATRIDVGGKMLTNLLAEMISFKEVNLQGETFVVNDIKEKLCYVSENFEDDMEASRKRGGFVGREYVLPDQKNIKVGYVKEMDADDEEKY